MTARRDGRSSPAGLARRLLVRSIGAAWLLLVVCLGTIWYAGQSTFHDEIVPEFRRQAQTVGADLAAQIRRAVDFGIPAQALVGVPALFETFLENHPRLAYVVLDDPRGGPLFAAHQPDAVSGLDPRRDVGIAIEIDDRLVGTLHVGVRDLHRGEFLWLGLWHALMLLVVASAALAWALAALIRRDAIGPLATVERLRAAFARGDWNIQARETGAPETRAALAALNSAFDQVAERRRRIDWLAREVAGSDARLATAAEALRGTLPNAAPTNAPPAGARLLQPMRGAAAPAFLFFVVCLAYQLVAWAAPLAAPVRASLELAAGGMPGEGWVVEIWPVVVGLVALLAAALLHVGIARLNRPAPLFAGAALLAVAGQMLCLVRTTEAMLVTGRAVAIFGVAVLALVCGHSTRSGTRNTATLTAAAAAVLVGAGAGALLANDLGRSAGFIVSILILLIAIPFGLGLHPRVNGAHSGARQTAWVLAPLGVLAGASLAALAAAALPASGGGDATLISAAVAGYGLVMLGLIQALRRTGARAVPR